MSKINYDDYVTATSKRSEKNESNVKFFGLKDDGDEAIVRFAYTSPSEFDLVTVHSLKCTTKEGKEYFRKVSCLKDHFYDKDDVCPICALGKDNPTAKIYRKFYVKLVVYTKDAQGNVVAEPKIWERPAKFSTELGSYFTEYGDISNYLFKIKRHGKAKDTDTSYTIIPANSAIYKEEVYVKDFSGFDGFKVEGVGYSVKSFDELQHWVETGSLFIPKEDTDTTQEKSVPTEDISIGETLAAVTTAPVESVTTAEVVTKVTDPFVAVAGPRRYGL